jgi:two-component system cell cycle response regulator
MPSNSDQLETERILCSLKEPDQTAMREHVRGLERRVSDLSNKNMELVAENRVLAEISARDSLTGLYNRWYVLEKIESEINRSLRHRSPMALLLLDLDHFKNVNDTYGHLAGDQVLQFVGRLLKESCRVYDVPGRYGGEEFCLLLPETTLRSTPRVAERIRHRLETTEMALTGASVVVTASIGIAGIDNESSDPVLSPGMLIERADRALYLAKNQGRNRVAMWDADLSGAKPLEH